jgi:hypothetical protein
MQGASVEQAIGVTPSDCLRGWGSSRRPDCDANEPTEAAYRAAPSSTAVGRGRRVGRCHGVSGRSLPLPREPRQLAAQCLTPLAF